MAVRARAAQRTRAPPSPLEAEKRKGEVEEKRRGKQKRNELSSLASGGPEQKSSGYTFADLVVASARTRARPTLATKAA